MTCKKETKGEKAVYDEVSYMGKTLKEWCVAFKNEFTLGELYRMMLNGEDFKMHVR